LSVSGEAGRRLCWTSPRSATRIVDERRLYPDDARVRNVGGLGISRSWRTRPRRSSYWAVQISGVVKCMPVTSAELTATKGKRMTQPAEKAAHSSGSTNSRPALELHDPLPSEHPRWRWNARERRWTVFFQGHQWTINSAEDSHVWFFADIHRLNLFTQLTKAPQ
jgi:hypothetical protein